MDIRDYISSGILEAYALDTLSATERAEVDDMLAKYPEIRQELLAIEENLELLALETAVRPPADLKANILKELEPTAAAEPAPVQQETKVVSMDPPKSNIWNYVAAAAIALALISSYMAYDYHNKWKGAQDAYSQLQAANSQMADQYNQVNNRLDQLVADIDVIGNADFARINMSEVNPGESLSASIYWNAKTEEAYLNVQNLKSLTEEQQYQLWAIVDGTPVDLGVFNFDQQGLVKMKNVGNASMFAVTIEPKGGSENPTMEAMQVAGQVG